MLFLSIGGSFSSDGRSLRRLHLASFWILDLDVHVLPLPFGRPFAFSFCLVLSFVLSTDIDTPLPDYKQKEVMA